MRLLRSQKRIRLSEESIVRDRLSELPDEIIVHILSCLPTIEAVRTVLLRRFGDLWTFIHNLNFDVGEYLNNCCYLREGCRKHIRWFYSFVHNVVMRHQNPSIERFRLSIERADLDIPDIDITTWWSFPLCRKAKEISIYDIYFLPKFTSQFLFTLELEFCKFEGEFQVELRSLKKLSLNRVWISDQNFKRLISGCPSLQELVISNPCNMSKLSLGNPNIDKLSLVLTDDRGLSSCVLLYVPTLKSLYLEIENWELDIVDVSSVRNIYIKSLPSLTMKEVVAGKFVCLQDFRLSREFSQAFLFSITILRLLQCKWRRIVLELHSNFCGSSLKGIYHLMNSLQHLEELVIYTTEDFKANGHLVRTKFPPPYVTPQLKSITLYGYAKSWKCQLQLVKILLKTAAALEKLIIVHMDHRLQEAEHRKFLKHASSFPWASSTASIIY